VSGGGDLVAVGGRSRRRGLMCRSGGREISPPGLHRHGGRVRRGPEGEEGAPTGIGEEARWLGVRELGGVELGFNRLYIM